MCPQVNLRKSENNKELIQVVCRLSFSKPVQLLPLGGFQDGVGAGRKRREAREQARQHGS